MESVSVAKETSSFLPAGYLSSSIGRKMVVAVTGFVMLLFAIGHMIGNLQVLLGAEELNRYAERLQSLGEFLWIIRAIMAVMLILHVWFAIMLKLENWQARPRKYEYNATVQATLASRTMIWTGLLVLAFVTYHLLHFTLVVTSPDLAQLRAEHNVYGMVLKGFQNAVVSAFYLVMMFLLAYHLSHGVKSMFQTIGWNNDKYEPGLNKLGYAVAALLFLGYVSVPVTVWLGIVK